MTNDYELYLIRTKQINIIINDTSEKNYIR